MANSAKPSIKNVPASVMARLRNEAVRRKADVNQVLTRYVLERLLYRIAASKHADQFILKGAFVYVAWLDADSFRPTGDLDLLGSGENSPHALAKTFAEIIKADAHEDGLIFDEQTIAAEPIREGQRYEGVRVSMTARLGSANIPALIDIGFGDAVTPKAKELTFPALLDAPAPKIRAYPKETVVAEKLEAMVSIGRRTSRMKDFYDILALSRLFPFSGLSTAKAIKATFERRGTSIPDSPPLALQDAFGADRETQAQWLAFTTRNPLLIDLPDLPNVLAEIRMFVMPPANAAARCERFNKRWKKGAWD